MCLSFSFVRTIIFIACCQYTCIHACAETPCRGAVLIAWTTGVYIITVLIQYWQILVVNPGMTKPEMDRHSCFNLVWVVASFPGIPTVQFFCSKQKWRGKAWSILSHKWRQCLPRMGRGSPLKKQPYLVVFAPSTEVLNICEVKNVPLACTKYFLSIGDPSVPLST